VSTSLLDRISENRRLLGNPYAYLDGDGRMSATPVLVPIMKGGGYTDIESRARELQIDLWRRRKELGFSSETRPLDVLNPELALQELGFDVHLEETLGFFRDGLSREIEVAGIIDTERQIVRVSRRVQPEVRLFTLAHELGHAALGHKTGLHRDRSLSGDAISRDPEEAAADKFATAFLMPRKQVCSEFEAAFLASSFVITEATAYALTRSDLQTFQRTYSSKRAVARLLASIDRFNGNQVVPLNRIFRVSVEAMAIRLEELGLV
jgi:Zn-dependent peptidase ImmA (M78 family)